MSSVEMQEQLDRIEAKLDALILALAEEGEDARPTHDLEGEPIPSVMEQHDTL